MRIYLPATLVTLRAAHESGVVGVNPVAAHGVTPRLREWFMEGDQEELEHAAFLDAAASALRLLAADPSAPRRRVVVSVDVADHATRAAEGGPGDGEARSAVIAASDIPLTAIASVHVDDEEATADVAAAAAALAAADTGDDDAQFTVDGAEGHDLLWYDATELADLLDER